MEAPSPTRRTGTSWGGFAPRHDPDPASCITVWVRMATTAPYLRVRWTPGVRLADVDGYDARAELLGMNSGHDRHPSSEGSRPHRSGVNQTLSSPELLRRAGVSEGTLRDLGLARSPYVGIGGAIDVPDADLGGVRIANRLLAGESYRTRARRELLAKDREK